MSSDNPPERIGNLPLELYTLICDQLDLGSLLSLSQISKQYRGWTESSVYRHISFTLCGAKYARLLLLQLIARPELAVHIKTISLRDSREIRNETSPDAWPRSHVEIHAAISSVINLRAASTQRSRTLSDKLSESPSTQEENLESTFALITDRAVSVESIIVESSSLHYGGGILSDVMTTAHPRSVPVLRQRTYRTVKVSPTIEPSLEELIVIGGHVDMHVLGEHVATKLHTLQLVRAKMSFSTLSKLCGRDMLSLKKLLLEAVVFDFDAREAFEEHLDGFTATLRDHCPQLEHLQIIDWMQNVTHSHRKVIPDFRQLASLETLCIDHPVLIRSGNWSKLLQPEMLLPPNITSLELRDVDTIPSREFFTKGHFDSQDRQDLIQMVSGTQIKKISVVAKYSDKPVLSHELLHLVSTLHTETGCWLQICCCDGTVILRPRYMRHDFVPLLREDFI